MIDFYFYSNITYDKIEDFPVINEHKKHSDQLNGMREKETISVNELVPSDELHMKEKKTKFIKEKKNYSKTYKCEECDRKYTWYSELANHKRFVHKKQKGK